MTCGNWIADKCFICFSERNANEVQDSFPSFMSEGDLEENVIRREVKVIFLLKKLFNLPESTCCQFLQRYGNPSSWIYWCDCCSVFVDKAKELFDEVVMLERRIDLLKRNIEDKINSSGKNGIYMTEENDKNEPTQIIRHYIMQSFLIDSGILPEVKVKIESDFYVAAHFSEGCSSGDEFLGGFSEGEQMASDADYDDNESKRFNIKKEDSSMIKTLRSRNKGNKRITETLETDKSLKENIHQCSLCSKTFSCIKELKNHQRNHPPPCPYCKEKFSKRNDFKSHVMIHEGEEMIATNCDICHEDFSYFEDIINHNCNPADIEDSEHSDHSEDHYIKNYDLKGKKIRESSSPKDSSFVCFHCNRIFKNKKNLTRHLIIHSDNRPFQCSSCDKSFRHKKNLLDHERIHSGDNIVSCDVCDKKLSFGSLTKHMGLHMEKPLSCTECGKSFPTETTLRTHSKIHTGEKPHACTFCEKRFLRKWHLTEHERSHTGEKPFSCSDCEKRFSTAKAFRIHLQTHTGEPSKYICSICGKSSQTKCDNEKHERTHSGEKPFTCSVCGRGLASSSSLTDHMKTHEENKERAFLCTTCGKSFSSPRYLKHHEKIHTGIKPFACNFCHMKFVKKITWAEHERTHTGVKPYSCSFCDASFKHNRQLKAHIRSHTGEPAPFHCSFCDKPFEVRKQKVNHERTHTGEKPYQCHICPKSFPMFNSRKVHIDKVHYKIPGKFSCPLCEKRFHSKYHLTRHAKGHEASEAT